MQRAWGSDRIADLQGRLSRDCADEYGNAGHMSDGKLRRRHADQYGYAGHISESLTVDLRLFQGDVQPRKAMNLTGRRHVLSASQFPEKTILDPNPYRNPRAQLHLTPKCGPWIYCTQI